MMQSGSVYARPTLVHRISENDSSLWRTPQAHDGKSSKIQQGYTTDLTHQVFYPTPTAQSTGYNKSKSPNAKVRPSLAMMARQGLWPTPKATQRGGVQSEMKRHSPDLHAVVKMWPTPVAQDGKNSALPPSQQGRDTLPGALVRLEAKGSLNPTWVEVLQGFPPNWTEVED
jgi:hypothetical protein